MGTLIIIEYFVFSDFLFTFIIMKPKHFLTVVLLLFSAIIQSSAQSPFFKRYYTPGGECQLFQMPDSTLVMVGGSQGSSPIGITQFDSDGNPFWVKELYMGGIAKIKKTVHDIQGNWIVLSENNWMIKLDSAFNVLWCNLYNSSNFPNLVFSDFVTHDSDSSYYITGNSDAGWLNGNPSLLLLKLSYDGSVQWAKAFDALNTVMPLPYPTIEVGTSITKLSDDNLLVGGTSDNDTINTSNNMTLFKFNKAGDLLWNSVILQFPPCAGFCDTHIGIEQIQEAADHNLYLGGMYSPYSSSSNSVYIMKTDSMGDPVWPYWGHEINNSKFIKFVLNPDSSVYFGCEYEIGSIPSPRIDKLSVNGQLSWSQYYYPNLLFQGFSDFISSPDGGIFGAGGNAGMDPAYIFKTDSTGSAGCYTFTAGINLGGMPNLVTTSPVFPYSESPVSVNFISQPFTDSTFTVTQYVYCGLVSSVENINHVLNIFPNPADDEVTVSGLQNPASSFEIFNLVGGKVLEGNMHSDNFTIPLTHFIPGVYILNVYSGKTIFREKLVVK